MVAEARYLLKSRAMVIKIPGFFFSSYPQTSYGMWVCLLQSHPITEHHWWLVIVAPMLVSMDAFAKIMGKINEMRRDGLLDVGATLEEAEQRIAAISPSPPMQRLLMKLIPGATLAQVCFDASSLVYSRVFGH